MSAAPARAGQFPYGVTGREWVSVADPEDPHGWPIFEGLLEDAAALIPGAYAATAGDDGDGGGRPVTVHIDAAGVVSLFEDDEQPDQDSE